MITSDPDNREAPRGRDEAGLGRGTQVGAIGFLIGAFLVLHGLNRVTADIEVLRIGEQTLWTWLTSSLFVVGALSAFLFARLQAPGERWPWVVLGVLMLALSFDEAAAIHERIEEEGGSDLSFLVLQPLIALSVLALFVRLLRGQTRDTRAWIVLAAGSLVLAQTISTIEEKVALSSALFTAEAISEELLEMLVPAFLLAATLPAVWGRLAPVFDIAVRRRRSNPSHTSSRPEAGGPPRARRSGGPGPTRR